MSQVFAIACRIYPGLIFSNQNISSENKLRLHKRFIEEKLLIPSVELGMNFQEVVTQNNIQVR